MAGILVNQYLQWPEQMLSAEQPSTSLTQRKQQRQEKYTITSN